MTSSEFNLLTDDEITLDVADHFLSNYPGDPIIVSRTLKYFDQLKHLMFFNDQKFMDYLHIVLPNIINYNGTNFNEVLDFLVENNPNVLNKVIFKRNPLLTNTNCRAYIENPNNFKYFLKKLKITIGYEPKDIENCDYNWSLPLQRDKRFTICFPPPNVTGSLHVGHALTCAIQDAIVRHKRMTGHQTMWIPGTDHAGISTQSVVARQLMQQKGLNPHDLGRELFLNEVWNWKEHYHERIILQLKRLGCLLDWDQEYFTMDEKLSRATHEAFLRLYRQGLIYRTNRLVNWDSTLKTTISDIEIDKITFEKATPYRYSGYDKPVELGVMDYFYYPLERKIDGVDRIEIATTRIETMLGDTAIAIDLAHPIYGKLVGKKVIHPFTGRKIPVIYDEMADPTFGTGAVKITPAHDPNDYQCGLRHQLEIVNVLNERGHINENGGNFQGMHRFDARKAIIKQLRALDLYHKRVDHSMIVPISSRTGEPIEYHLKPQWYLNCKEMAQMAIKAVERGNINIHPKTEEREYFRWLENIQDWCISRQLWWGHRVPLYRSVNENGEESWSEKPEDGEQDEDVLDTWFSSALLPLSCRGWPEVERTNLEPLDLMETGKDILFFWVTRMIMMSLQLTGQIPFRQVLLHGLVRDQRGRKMAKSLGNVIDPLDVIDGITQENMLDKISKSVMDPKEKQYATKETRRLFPKGIPDCGTDALRFTLFKAMNGSQDLHLNINEVIKSRHFCNKLYNLTQFVIQADSSATQFVIQTDSSATQFYLLHSETSINTKQSSGIIEDEVSVELSFLQRWIQSRLEQTKIICNRAFLDYSFHLATRSLYEFFYTNLCDVYLEAIKPKMQETFFATLRICLLEGLKLLHPFMPFISQSLFNLVKNGTFNIMLEDYPRPMEDRINITTETKMSQLLETVHQILATKAEKKQTRKDRPIVHVSKTFDAEQLEIINTLGFCQASLFIEEK